jgi:hypothetical protein
MRIILVVKKIFSLILFIIILAVVFVCYSFLNIFRKTINMMEQKSS